MAGIKIVRWTALAAAAVLVSCTNPLSMVVNRDIANDQASHQPGAQVNPSIASGRAITAHEILQFTFTESINTATVTFSGELAVGTLTWATTSKENDTLTYSPPATYWPAGASQKLTISGKTKAGGSIASNSLTYGVFRGMCVSATGSDLLGSGSVLTPFLTISNGISMAGSKYGTPSQVRVSAGVYHINTEQTATRIVMAEGISLYGGYDPTFTNRAYDSAHEVQILNDATNGTMSRPPMGTVACSNVSSATTLDGFTICAGGTASSAAAQYFAALTLVSGCTINVTNNKLMGGGNYLPSYDVVYVADSRPTIRGNTITGNGADKTAGAVGIYYGDTKSDAGTCLIADNTISSGGAKDMGNGTIGIWISSNVGAAVLVDRNTISAGLSDLGAGVQINNTKSTSVVVRNNVIESCQSKNMYGVAVLGSTGNPAQPFLFNNTIVFGNTTNMLSGRGIELYAYGNPRIENNIIANVHAYTANPHVTIGIHESVSTGMPYTVYNNDFYCFDNDTYWDLYYDASSGNYWHTVVLMELDLQARIGNSYGANLGVNPAFVSLASHDYHLLSTTAVSTGGLTMSGFTVDHDSVTRTTPWSIGAFEKD